MGLAERFERAVNRNILWRFFLNAETTISVGCAIVGVLGVCYNVITRYIFHKNFFGMDDLLAIVMIYMYFLGCAFASYDRQQIKADILSSFVKNPFKSRVLRAFQEVFSAAVCGLYTVWLAEYVYFNFEAGSVTSVLKCPQWVPQASLLIGFFFMTVYHSYNGIFDTLSAIDISRERKGAS